MQPTEQRDDSAESLGRWIASVANQRDRQAFNRLYDHYVPLLRAYSLARDPGATSMADELAQEVMIKIWVAAARYDVARADPNAWVFTLARNCRIDMFRRNRRHWNELKAENVYDRVIDENPGPMEQAHSDHIGKSIRSKISRLPREQSDLLAIIYLEGKSHREASEALQVPLGTVKSRIGLALNKLAVMI